MKNYIGRDFLNVFLTNEQENCEIFEVIFNATSLSVIAFRGIEGEIKPEIIKHANDVNIKTEQDLKEYQKNNETLPGITAEQIQDIIDRSHLYGQDFLKAVFALFDDFPIKVEMVKVQEDDKASSIRKVTKI